MPSIFEEVAVAKVLCFQLQSGGTLDPSMTLALLAHRLLQEPCILIRSERLSAFSHGFCRARFAGMSVVVQAWAMTRPWRSIRSGAGLNAVLFKCFKAKKKAALPREVFWVEIVKGGTAGDILD